MVGGGEEVVGKEGGVKVVVDLVGVEKEVLEKEEVGKEEGSWEGAVTVEEVVGREEGVRGKGVEGWVGEVKAVGGKEEGG